MPAEASTSPAYNGDPHKPPAHQWDSKTYSAAASFVPTLTSKILRLVDPQPTDRILDVGCGDGVFTAKYFPHVYSVLGVDASESFVESANERLGGSVEAGNEGNAHPTQSSGDVDGAESRGKGEFRAKVVDCRFLERDEEVINGGLIKPRVSNAALHWILSSPTTRRSTLSAIHSSLCPSGTFIFEMGGKGNCAEVHTALTSALAHHTSISISEARECSPWWFPDEAEMREILEDVGFDVERLETEWRPTPLETGEGGRMEGWVRLMGKKYLDKAQEMGGQKAMDAVVSEVCEVLKDIVMRHDGSQWLGYVRLRGVCRKKG